MADPLLDRFETLVEADRHEARLRQAMIYLFALQPWRIFELAIRYLPVESLELLVRAAKLGPNSGEDRQ